jgi:hypothetical protein
VLLLAAGFALVLAASDPVAGAQQGPDRLVVVLDGSASMAARTTPDAASSQELALRYLRRRLARLPDSVTVEVVEQTGARLRRLAGPAAVALARPLDPVGELAVSLDALAQAAAAPDSVVWVLTDGQRPVAARDGVEVLRFGAPAENCAILAAEFTSAWPLAAVLADVRVANYGAVARNVTLQAHGAGLTGPQEVAALLQPGQSGSVRIELPRSAEGGEVVLAIDPAAGDGLSLDDRLVVQMPPMPPPRIAVRQEKGAPAFLTAMAQALAAELRGEVLEAEAGQRCSLLLMEGGMAELAPGALPLVAFGVRKPGAADPPKIWASPTALDWDRADPLMQGLDLSELEVSFALAEDLPSGRVLVWGEDDQGQSRPLAVAVTGERATSLHFAFRLQDSNLGLLPAFPQMVRRVLLLSRAVSGLPSLADALPGALESDLRNLGGKPEAEGQIRPGGAESDVDEASRSWGVPGHTLAPYLLLGALLLLAVRSGVAG